MSYTKYIISQLESSKEFIKDNWQDDISASYITWLSNATSSLVDIDSRREQMQSILKDIKQVCDSVTEDDDEPKRLTLKKTI